MVSEYSITILKSAQKDKEKVKSIAALKDKTDKLMEILKRNPFQNPPPYEKLVGEFRGMYSRRLNHQHRLVYKVDKEEKIVMIISMWTH